MGATITILNGLPGMLSGEAALTGIQFFKEYPDSPRPLPFSGDLCAIGVDGIRDSETVYRFSIYTPVKYGGTRSTEIAARLCDCLIGKQFGAYHVKKVSCGSVSFNRSAGRFVQQVLASVIPDTATDSENSVCIRMSFKDFLWYTLPETFTITNERQVNENFSSDGKPIISEIGSTITKIRGQGIFRGETAGENFRRLMDVFKKPGAGFLEMPTVPGINALFSRLECVSADDTHVKYSFEFIEV